MSIEDVDAILDPLVSDFVDNFICDLLSEQGISADRNDIPLCVTQPLELDAIGALVAGYEGVPRLTEVLSQWCLDLADCAEAFDTEISDDDANLRTGEDYIVEAMCRVLLKEFTPEPFNALLHTPDSAWSPPAYYWTLQKSELVVDCIKKIYEKHRGSEFINAFLQDYCERPNTTLRTKVADITAHFSIFIKTFGELLIEYMTDDSLDDKNHEVVKLLCHAENSYVYGQALLHFLPYHEPQFNTCKRLIQLCYRHLRQIRGERNCADRMLLCTSIANYPQLSVIFKQLEQTDTLGQPYLDPNSISSLTNVLQKIMRRFAKHKTLLLFHDTQPQLPPAATKEELDVCVPESNGGGWLWERELMERDDEETEIILENHPINPADLPETIDVVEWPVQSEVRKKQKLGVFWNLPSASQAGDEELIQEDLQDERDRRGQTRLNMPPMEAIRETLIMETLWEYIACPECVPSHVEAELNVEKLIELALILSVYSEYELVVMHLQDEENQSRSKMQPCDFGEEDLNVLERDFYASYASPQPDALQTEIEVDGWSFIDNGEHGAEFPEIMSGGKIPRLEEGELSPLLSKRLGFTGDRESVVSSYAGRSKVSSVIKSAIYKDPHEGSKLRAFVPEDKNQSFRLQQMFETSEERVEMYKYEARRELYKIFGIVRNCNDFLSDHTLAKLLLNCKTNSGASAVLRRLKRSLLVIEENSDPLERVTPATISILLRISVFHVRKRTAVVKIIRKLLQTSFQSEVPVTESVLIKRQNLIHVLMLHLGMKPFPPVAEDEAMPWRAAIKEAVTIPTFVITLDALMTITAFTDATLLRESIELLREMCSAPFLPAFANKLSRVLDKIIASTCFDFEAPINRYMRECILGLMNDVYAAWAPYNPPEQITNYGRNVFKKIGGSS